MKRSLTVAVFGLMIVVLAGTNTPLHAQDNSATVLFDMDAVRHRPTEIGEKKTPAGAVELVEGKVGKACKFTFAPDGRGGFFTAAVKTTPEWDEAAGISFWVKGDGSSNWGGLEMIDQSNFGFRYAYCFPIDSTEWRKIAVPWCDLIPETPVGNLVDAKTGYAPSKFGNLWFGKWYYWREYPACSFSIDQIALEKSIPVDVTDYTPAVGGTPRLLAKLKAKQPITVVTMGDSLSDKRHWANQKVLWSEVLSGKLKETFGSEVKLVNPALGGTQLTQNLILMPRWLMDTPAPDLVTVWFGYNDWDGGMRGDHFKDVLRLTVDRIRRMTKGKSEIVLLTTSPALGRWDEMEELAAAVRSVAAEKKTGLADVSAAFHKTGAAEKARATLFAWDKTHLGGAGHALAAETVLRTITGAK